MALNKQQLTLVSGLGLGAGLMYLLDPQGGRSRRTVVKDKTAQALSTSGNALRKTSQSLGSRSKDLAAGVRSKLSRNGSDSSEGVQALDSNLDIQSASSDSQTGGKLQSVRKWGGSAARVLAGTAGAGLAVAGAKRRDKVGAALGAVGLGLLAGSGAGQRLLALRHRGNGSSQEGFQNEESNSSLQAGSVTVNESEAPFATLGDTEAASELRSVVEGSSSESHVH